MEDQSLLMIKYGKISNKVGPKDLGRIVFDGFEVGHEAELCGRRHGQARGTGRGQP